MPQLDPSSPTIAVIDDDVDIVDVLLAALEFHGYTAVAWPPTAGILGDLHALQPALILLDVWMPEIDGITLALQLRQDPTTCHTPIVFMTAAPHEVRDRLPSYREQGMSILAKPFELLALYEAIDQALATSAAR